MFFKEDSFNDEKISVEKSNLDLQLNESCNDFFGPALPPQYSKTNAESEENETIHSLFAPDCVKEEDNDRVNEVSLTVLKGSTLIGPEIPKHLIPEQISSEIKEYSTCVATEDDNVGPSLTLMATEGTIGCYQILNSQNLHKKTDNVGEPNVKRESWMIELPEKKRAAFGLLPRHFKPQTQTDKESDDSVWTDTPASKKEKGSDISKKDHNELLRVKRLKERDKEMEKLAKKASKKLKKEKSLLEIHLKKMKKKKKKESKKHKKEKTILPERRPFDRNVDLRIIKYDEIQKRAALNKSQFLKDRFAPGQSKFL